VRAALDYLGAMIETLVLALLVDGIVSVL